MGSEPERAALRLVSRSVDERAGRAYLREGMDIAYQPIVHLGSGSVLAYEALARPRHPDAANPMVFFAALEEAGLRLEGERAAFRAALDGTLRDFPRVKLFLNASPTTLVDDGFDVTELATMAQDLGFSVSDLVIEVTESEAVEDLATLASRTERLRRLGMGLAVDDAGAGHASFKVITRLRPSYIKMDRDLVSGVDGDGARHAFLEAMVRFSRQIGARLIAEGVETEAELACLAGLGVEAGQGYFIARPQIGSFTRPSPEARRMIATAAQRPRLGAARVTAKELARPATIVARQVTVAESYARFLADPGLGLLVLTEHDRVVAQLTRRAVERFLASPGSWERLADRPAFEFADHHPLTVDGDLDVVELGAMLAARQRHHVADDVAVTDALGRLVGVLTVRDAIRALTAVRGAGDQELHPLSGLLGPGWIERDIARRIAQGERLSLLFVDVDRFRRLNDIGGFALGDDLIRVLSSCLSGVAAGVTGASLAHVGGDDFLLVAPPEHYEDVVSGFVRAFEAEVVPFLRLELRLHDALQVLDEVGLSMASVDLDGSPPPGHRHLAWAQDSLAPLMAVAKQQHDHSCVRRTGEIVAVTTWHPTDPGHRRITLGTADPEAVLALIGLIEASWAHWRGEVESMVRFPGPVRALETLHARFLAPLADLARAAVVNGEEAVPVEFTGPEPELLELMDRLALVGGEQYALRSGHLPPAITLLDRLARQRSRAISREERLGRVAADRLER